MGDTRKMASKNTISTETATTNAASAISPPHPSASPQHLNIRILMQGKEVGSIIGKKGEIVKRFREESGARINITDGSSPERIVSISGNSQSILKAVRLICAKFAEDQTNLPASQVLGKAPITFRLIIPASQCGSIIGKGGTKIKEIRESTNASIQVASEMLPNSTERAVTVSGGSEAITQCIYNICNIMAEFPPREGTLLIPYTPQKGLFAASPALFHFTQYGKGMVPAGYNGMTGIPGMTAVPTGFGPGILTPAALAALAGSSGCRNQNLANSHQTHEMTVPNEIIGCVIGKGGSKIAEIRQLSGAMIRISNCEDRDAPANLDRTITISGNCESVALAQYLINMRISMETAGMGGLAGFQYVSPNVIKAPVH